MLPERAPHPVKDLATAMENRRRICDPRGYCGPFHNAGFYTEFPDGLWQGTAECVHCRSTVSIARERTKRRLARRGFRVDRSPVSRYLPAPELVSFAG